jgi:hypothetical protein
MAAVGTAVGTAVGAVTAAAAVAVMRGVAVTPGAALGSLPSGITAVARLVATAA